MHSSRTEYLTSIGCLYEVLLLIDLFGVLTLYKDPLTADHVFSSNLTDSSRGEENVKEEDAMEEDEDETLSSHFSLFLKP